MSAQTTQVLLRHKPFFPLSWHALFSVEHPPAASAPASDITPPPIPAMPPIPPMPGVSGPPSTLGCPPIIIIATPPEPPEGIPLPPAPTAVPPEPAPPPTILLPPLPLLASGSSMPPFFLLEPPQPAAKRAANNTMGAFDSAEPMGRFMEGNCSVTKWVRMVCPRGNLPASIRWLRGLS